jgi:predicted nucleic acid-binding protein
VFAEVEEYAIVAREVYKRSIARAKREIGQRDRDDVELLALALHFKIPLWSNDDDFSNCGVRRALRNC